MIELQTRSEEEQQMDIEKLATQESEAISGSYFHAESARTKLCQTWSEVSGSRSPDTRKYQEVLRKSPPSQVRPIANIPLPLPPNAGAPCKRVRGARPG